MEPSPRPPRVFRFGVFEIDLEGRELRKCGVRQKLAGQPFQVLEYLLEHSQQVVSREELRRRLWPQNTFVDYDLALKKAINRIREVLGDSAESPRFIETIPRRGYRFIAAVEGNGNRGLMPSLAAAESGVPRAAASGRSLRIGLGFGLGAAVLLAAMLGLLPSRIWRESSRTLAPAIHSIAVLPLANLSGDPAEEYFCDGMTDALITDLAQIGSVKVISRTSVMRYKKTTQPLPQIARELNVDGIVEGTVQRSDDRVRITAQLIYAPSDKHLWAESYERKVQDVFALQRELTQEVAGQIEARVKTPVRLLPAQQPVNLSALEAYLQGNYYLNLGSGDSGMRKAEQFFQRAIAADRNYVPAYIGLAYSHYLLLSSTTDDRALRLAAAERAVALDPASSDAHSTLGEMKLADWEWSEAETELRRAITLSLNNARAHATLCTFLDVTGRWDESLGECQVAQQLDPDYDHLSEVMEARGDYDHAIEFLQRAIEHHPQDAFLRYFLYRDYALKGKYSESIRQLEKSLLLAGVPDSAVRVSHQFAAGGYRAALRQWATELEQLHASGRFFLPRLAAEVYAQLGEKDRAFYWLEQGYQQHASIGAYGGINWMLVEHELDPLRSDPRFKDLLHRVGLPMQRSAPAFVQN